jgi:hypothetical protein
MILINTRLFEQVVKLAQTASEGDAAMLRAIERSVNEINRSKFWSYSPETNTLKLISTTSGRLYVITDHHTCEAQSKRCKHFVARRLLQIYYSVEPLQAPARKAATPTHSRGSVNSAAASAV